MSHLILGPVVQHDEVTRLESYPIQVQLQFLAAPITEDQRRAGLPDQGANPRDGLLIVEGIGLLERRVEMPNHVESRLVADDVVEGVEPLWGTVMGAVLVQDGLVGVVAVGGATGQVAVKREKGTEARVVGAELDDRVEGVGVEEAVEAQKRTGRLLSKGSKITEVPRADLGFLLGEE